MRKKRYPSRNDEEAAKIAKANNPGGTIAWLKPIPGMPWTDDDCYQNALRLLRERENEA